MNASSPTTPWPEQCFVLGTELFEAVSFDEIDATWKDMESLGIAKPPYPTFDVVVPEGKIIELVDTEGNCKPADSGMQIRVRFLPDGAHANWLGRGRTGGPWYDLPGAVTLVSRQLELEDGRKRNDPEDMMLGFARTGGEILKLLVVLLATRNAMKERKECKLLKLGIGSKERNRYTTTIKIGKVTEHTEPSQAGGKKRPHLRRGHVRRQHYGPHNELVKQIFVEPVFVNADEGWIAERTSYNVGLQASRP